MFRNDRKLSKGGGRIIYCKSTVNAMVYSQNSKLLIGMLLIPFESDNEETKL